MDLEINAEGRCHRKCYSLNPRIPTESFRDGSETLMSECSGIHARTWEANLHSTDHAYSTRISVDGSVA